MREADDLADKNVTSFILEVPIACLVASASQPIIGGWTTASVGVGVPLGGPTPGTLDAGPAGPTPPGGAPAAQRPADGPGLGGCRLRAARAGCRAHHPAARKRGAAAVPASYDVGCDHP